MPPLPAVRRGVNGYVGGAVWTTPIRSTDSNWHTVHLLPIAAKHRPMEKPTLPGDDYDTPWKDALTRYFPEFMAFYFPRAAAEIDLRQAHVFLD